MRVRLFAPPSLLSDDERRAVALQLRLALGSRSVHVRGLVLRFAEVSEVGQGVRCQLTLQVAGATAVHFEDSGADWQHAMRWVVWRLERWSERRAARSLPRPRMHRNNR